MLFRLCAAQTGLSAPARIVCLHAILCHLSEEKMGESHSISACNHADCIQCDLIDLGHSLHIGAKYNNMETL